MRTLVRLLLFGAALAAPPVLAGGAFVAVLAAAGSDPTARSDAAYDPTRCTWYCHDHDCRHDARLPEVLAGNDGAFGLTIAGLAAAGRATGIGYTGMNLLVFCVAWPLITYLLYAVAVGRAIWNLL